jgi:hypothetical protein
MKYCFVNVNFKNFYQTKKYTVLGIFYCFNNI